MKAIYWVFISLFLINCDSNINQSYEYTDDWQFKNTSKNEWLPAVVPGVVHLDLLENDIIANPYQGNNEVIQQWIEKENWLYQSTWKVGDDLLKNEHIELAFQGLDTYAKVFLNDTLIIEADNMFRTWKQEVRHLLKKGDNILKVQFTSPLIENGTKVETYPYQLPSGNETVDLKVSAFTRKAAYQFGWDWGPRFVSSGIWRPIKINAWNGYRIIDLHVKTKSIKENKAKLDVEVSIDSDRNISATILINDKTEGIAIKKGNNKFLFPITVDKPKLWWPNGSGDQPLYEMKVMVMENGKAKDSKLTKYGIRTIELVNEADSIGTSFYFKVNGQPIFMKGANYIPQDIFPSRVLPNQYHSLIQKVREANMNMLRVWGGGIYEDDLFYELCDENGILIWQDFMFAGSMYPNDAQFHTNVVNEVVDNVTRLRNHPSIALWCGNNEIDVAWKNWGWQDQYEYSQKDSTEIWHNYLKIFQEEIPQVIQKLTPSIDYVTTSPLSNWGTPENFNHSSMHYWGVWHGREPLENFNTNVGRFMSEYGFQSFPSYESLASIMDTTMLSIDSEIMNSRQKSYIGNEMITSVSERHFGESSNFKEYILNSQKTQSLALKTAIQAHRLNKPNCMGTLFWQLNDVWQGPSWSVLEYEGKPKLAYDEVKKWYQQVVVIPKVIKDSIDFFVVSDQLSAINLKLIVYPEDGNKIELPISLNPNEVKNVVTLSGKTNYQLELIEDDHIIFKDTIKF